MERKVKKLYMTPMSEPLQLCNDCFLCASQTRSAGLQDYYLQPEEEF